jgi:murein DD-endopeptidase MepM/ murein hydrolase activator NlpD
MPRFVIKKSLILVVFIFNLSVFSQESSSYKKIAKLFVTHFNEQNTPEIYNLFSSEMKATLPQERIHQVINSLQGQLGKIIRYEFLRINEATATYKANFEKSPLLLKITLNELEEMTGLLFKPYKEQLSNELIRNKTALKLPFKGAWNILWGGTTLVQNQHVAQENQQGAFDMLIIDENGKSYVGNGSKNEDYYAFDKAIIAPCNAEVVLAVDGVKDNNPGETNPTFFTGNTVILKTAHNEYLLFAHLKQHSIAVKEGDHVKTGQLLGRCGNSGNSSETHLHFHIQNVEALHHAIGVWCYFDKIMVNGELKSDYLPIKHDVVKNISD